MVCLNPCIRLNGAYHRGGSAGLALSDVVLAEEELAVQVASLDGVQINLRMYRACVGQTLQAEKSFAHRCTSCKKRFAILLHSICLLQRQQNDVQTHHRYICKTRANKCLEKLATNATSAHAQDASILDLNHPPGFEPNHSAQICQTIWADN